MAVVIDKHVLEVLNELIETAKNGEYGFAKCAERVNSPALQDALVRRSIDCQTAAKELQALVLEYGGKPRDGGSVLGALHRGWVSVKDMLSVDSDHAVLEECERGEDWALGAYRKALRTELPGDVHEVVSRQMAGTRANHDRVKALRDAHI